MTWRRHPTSSNTSSGYHDRTDSRQAPASKVRKTYPASISERDTFHGNFENKKKKHFSSVMSLTYGLNGGRPRACRDPLSFLTFDNNMSLTTYLPDKTSIRRTLYDSHWQGNNQHVQAEHYSTISMFVANESDEPSAAIIDKSSGYQSKKNREVFELMNHISTMEDLRGSGRNVSLTDKEASAPENHTESTVEKNEENLPQTYVDSQFGTCAKLKHSCENNEELINQTHGKPTFKNLENGEEYSDDNLAETPMEFDAQPIFENQVKSHGGLAVEKDEENSLKNSIDDDSEKPRESTVENPNEFVLENRSDSTVVNSLETYFEDCTEPVLEKCSEPTAVAQTEPVRENLKFSVIENCTEPVLEKHSEHTVVALTEPLLENLISYSHENFEEPDLENGSEPTVVAHSEPVLGYERPSARKICIEPIHENRSKSTDVAFTGPVLENCPESAVVVHTEHALRNERPSACGKSTESVLKDHTKPTVLAHTEPVGENLRFTASENCTGPALDTSKPVCKKNRKENALEIPTVSVDKDCRNSVLNSPLNVRSPEFTERSKSDFLANYVEPLLRMKPTDSIYFETNVPRHDRTDGISKFQSQKNKEVVELMRQMTDAESGTDDSFGNCAKSPREDSAERNIENNYNVEISCESLSAGVQNVNKFEDTSVPTNVNPGENTSPNNALRVSTRPVIVSEPAVESRSLSIRESRTEQDSIENHQSGSVLINDLEEHVDYGASGNHNEAYCENNGSRNRSSPLENNEHEIFEVNDFDNREEFDLQNGASASRTFEEASAWNTSSLNEQEIQESSCPTAQGFYDFADEPRWRVSNTRNTALTASSHIGKDFVDNYRPCCFDAFLNIENMCQVLWKRKAWSFSRSPLNAILNHEISIKFLPRIPVEVIGGVMVFDDPNCFPRKSHLDPAWKFSVGVHPKHAPFLTDAQFGILSTFIQGKGSPALGTIGYDHSQNEKFWDIQNEVFCKLLGLSRPDKPIIIHIRGEEGDLFGSELHKKCLKRLQKRCPRDQLIHLHSFRGTSDDVNRWISTFPKCYFGFSWMVKDFVADQWSAFRSVPMERILLETGIVHRLRQRNPRMAKGSIKRPAHLGDLAAMLASVRVMDFEHFLRQTLENGKRLYTK
ncbi:hypothetical protein FSP39_010577 [Pinctada imbricata]|uniref:Uncharacterized protein n=1 Tax=Pinctada imbricata TaxID=66713 RepID=A0AA88Y8L1_PINIB|nr:hypothetical protein FSP39_010577 [Pinctada imbricata]